MGKPTNGRFQSRNSTVRVDCQRLEQDVQKSRETVQESLDVIDETLRSVPESVELMMIRQDVAGVKDVLALAGSANNDAERLKNKKADIDQRFERAMQSRPSKERHYADHYATVFGIGAEYINLNQETGTSAGMAVGQLVEILNKDAPSAKPTEEVKS